MQPVSYGAEAVIIQKSPNLLKKRLKKGYRNEKIDALLRSGRNRREYRLLQKLALKGFPVPHVIEMGDYAFSMEEIKGKKIRDCLTLKSVPLICPKIGKLIAKLHNESIIHGDLTTSNLIWNRTLSIIDFGLSYQSHRIEDKAVDLHLLRQALTSKHWRIAEKAFASFLRAYRKYAIDAEKILERFEVVESRGRYKGKA
ncbi:MAG: KEOPS complex kinase/ATPase Bud32 [Nanoarchaeota archaeon]